MLCSAIPNPNKASTRSADGKGPLEGGNGFLWTACRRERLSEARMNVRRFRPGGGGLSDQFNRR